MQESRGDREDAPGPTPRAAAGGAPAGCPERLGPYRVLGVLGAGASGVVYEAEQDHPRRRVALKLLRADLAGEAGVRLRRRFEVEAELLARLHHPAVAHVYDAGTAETDRGLRPFVAMELVEGRRLDRWLAEEDPDDRARLRVLAALADGVHHAHRQGVVHRDLKPANVLVDADGRPRVVDFGVARLVREFEASGEPAGSTRAGELVGSLPYASPEQLRGDSAAVDARSDVYALGAIAYEMFAASPPVPVAGRPLAGAVRAVLEEEPTRLGTLVGRLRGDVETIVHKALEKEPARRYASAAELAADVRRHLADRPIEARPPTTWYQLAKFSRRHRRLVAAGAATFVALVGAATASTAFYVRAETLRVRAERASDLARARRDEAVQARDDEARQRASAEEAEQRARRDAGRAREEARLAARVSGFLEELFEEPADGPAAGAPGPAAETTARELLDRAAERVDAGLDDAPELRCRLLGVMGGVYANLGLGAPAAELLDRALELRASLGGADSARGANLLRRRAEVHRNRGEYAEAEEAVRRARDVLVRELGEDSPDAGWALTVLAGILRSRGEYAESRELHERALAVHRPLRPSSLLVAELEGGLGALAALEGRPGEALDHLLASIEIRRELGQPVAAATLDSVGQLHVERGEYALAEQCFRESLEAARARLGDEHPDLTYPLVSLGDMLRERGAFEEAEAMLLRAVELAGSAHRSRGAALNNLGLLRDSQERFDEAIELFRQALAEHERRAGPRAFAAATTRGNLGQALAGARRYPEALEELQAALTLLREIAPDNRAHHALALYNVGNVMCVAGMLDDAVPVLEESYAIDTSLFGADFQRARWSAQLLAYCYDAMGQAELAREWTGRMQGGR